MPQTAGNSESFIVSGLIPGQTYYFAIKTQDEIPNTSGLSNSPNAIASSGTEETFEWWLEKGSVARTGKVNFSGPKTIPKKVWEINGVIGNPLYIGSKLYVQKGSGAILENPPDGVILRESADLNIARRLSYKDGILYAASDRIVYALNIEDFGIIWQFDTNDYVAPQDILPYKDKVYFGTFYDKKVHSLDAKTGNIVWQYTGATEVSLSFFAISEPLNLLYVPFMQSEDNGQDDTPPYEYYRTTRDARLVALNLDTGEEVWNILSYTHLQGSLAVNEGRLYFSPVWMGLMYVVDAASGEFLWKAAVSDQPRGGGVVVGNGVAFSGGKPGILTGYDIKTQAQVFRYPAQSYTEYIIFPPVIDSDGSIYFQEWKDIFHVVDIATKQELWQIKIEPAGEMIGRLVSPNRIYINHYAYGDAKVYTLYAFEE